MSRLLSFFRTGRGLRGYAAFVLFWMILVILEGAVVRATGSGAGCGNHWPLCNGDVIPRHPRLATIIEFTHRSLTGVCTTLVAGLIAWIFLARRPGNRARKAAAWTGILLITEAFLGAVLVKGGFVEHNTSNLRVLVQSVHFTNTMLLLAALTLAWWWQQPIVIPAIATAASRRFAALAFVSLLLTGATGSVAALADTLFPAPNLHAALLADLSSASPLLVRTRWMHPAASVLAVIALILLARIVRGRRAQILLALLGAQLALGIADVLALAPLSLQVLHLLGADLLWIALIAVASECLLPVASTKANSVFEPSTVATTNLRPGQA